MFIIPLLKKNSLYVSSSLEFYQIELRVQVSEDLAQAQSLTLSLPSRALLWLMNPATMVHHHSKSMVHTRTHYNGMSSLKIRSSHQDLLQWYITAQNP